MKLSWLLGATAVGALSLAGGIAFPTASEANTVTYEFHSDHCTGGCLTGQTLGGTVKLTDGAAGTNSVDVLVTLLNGNAFVNGGQDASFGFNLTGDPTITYSAVSSGWAPVGPNPTGAQVLHLDGTGDFGYGLECSGGQGNGANSCLKITTLSFTITDGAGFDITKFTTNADGQLFAADIFSGTTGLTGFIDASVPAPVVGAGLPGLLAACSGLVMLGRRRRQKMA